MRRMSNNDHDAAIREDNRRRRHETWRGSSGAPTNSREARSAIKPGQIIGGAMRDGVGDALEPPVKREN